MAGRILDEEGNPLGDVRVALRRGEKSDLPQVATDKSGRFHQAVPGEEPVTLLISRPGYVGQKLKAAPGDEVEVVLARAARIGGRLRREGRDTFPPFRIEVLRHEDSEWKRGPIFRKDDPAGRFTLELPAGLYILAASGQGFAGQSDSFFCEPGEEIEGVVIEIPATGAVRGRVALWGIDEPLEGAEVKLQRTDRRSKPFLHSPVRTGPDGTFVLEEIPAGAWTLTASHPRHPEAQTRLVTVRGEESAEVEFVFPSGTGTIEGSLTLEGAPLPHATVTVSAVARQTEKATKGASTDASGRFRFSGLPAGEYRLEGRFSTDGAIDNRDRPLAGASWLPADPAGGAVLHLTPASSAADGILKLEGLPPGEYRLLVVHQLFAPARALLQIPPGEGQATVTMKRGGRLEIQVVSGDSGPLAEAEVEVLESGGRSVIDELNPLSPQLEPLVVEGRPGPLVLDPLGPGTYRVTARKGSRRSREETVEVPAGGTARVRLSLGEP